MRKQLETDMKLLKTLERLEELLTSWRINPSDWILVAQYAYRLLGYKVKVRKGHLNIIVKETKIPWKLGEELETHAPSGTKYGAQYYRFLRRTGFDFDLIPRSSKDFRRKTVDFIIYSLPNKKRIQVQTPLGAIRELEDLLGKSKKEGWGEEKGARVLEFVKDQIQAFIKRKEYENANIYKKLLRKYKRLVKVKKVSESDLRSGKIKGIIVSGGIVKGIVNVVLDPEKKKIFRKGDVLVTTMTSTKFTTYLKRALALVTDEGGMLSHAAIIAREMGIPCIVGTKIATKVLKDGDVVQVDAIKGVVRKIKNA